ncbi:unnamed protein product [Trichogramma brassicae]|uniref:Uncharacterized protein n=1 Tax=Trichogramma brassicae TaxID=86971 RepID=A0A6H5IVM3_9HYME|nr:unnamed protein product [Trichogramma brassicae]
MRAIKEQKCLRLNTKLTKTIITLTSLEKLKYLRRDVNWEDEEERRDFLSQLHPLITDWEGQLPNLRDIFRPEEIDWLLTESVLFDNAFDTNSLIDFVIDSGYKDELVFDEDGKPLLRRTTPLHQVVSIDLARLLPKLFKIYQRSDANYTTEFGFSHFHVACMNGFNDIVQEFLEFGQDPNCFSEEPYTTSSVDLAPPLHLALRGDHWSTAELLLRSGADPNSCDTDGWTVLHSLQNEEMAEMLFEFCDKIEKPVQVDAHNELIDTPLCLAVRSVNEKFIELLLKRGADPNLPNEDGSTPLHIMARNHCLHNDGLAGLFFRIIDEAHKQVQIDSLNKLGRTPLQLAVANVQPCMVDVLLDCGADLSRFVFPAKRSLRRGRAAAV